MIVAAVVITCQIIFVAIHPQSFYDLQTEAVVLSMISATLMGLPYVQLLRGSCQCRSSPLFLPNAAFYVISLFPHTRVYRFSMFLVNGPFMPLRLASSLWERLESDTVWGIKLWISLPGITCGFFSYFFFISCRLSACAWLVKDTPFGLEDK